MPSTTLATMSCPKCAGEMRTYERSGVHVDQCRDCRGLFLDRGELERLIDLEAAFAAPPPAWTRPGSDDRSRQDAVQDTRPDPRAAARVPEATPDSPRTPDRRSERGEGLGDVAELGEVGGFGALGALGELGELFERRSPQSPGRDERAPQGQPQRKRGGLFRELFEGFGD